jgi:hypothetical protein
MELESTEAVMRFWRKVCALTAFAAVLAPAVSHGSAHLWVIKEIFTNHDGSVQFIELFTAGVNERFLNIHTITANSDGLINTYEFPSDLTTTTTNKHLLIATANFGSLPGGVPQDYATAPPLPANFFIPNATSIEFIYGHTIDHLTVAGSQIPKDGVNSLTDTNLAINNGPDVMVAGVNSPTNFGGQTGLVNLPPPASLPGDFTGNNIVDGNDLAVWRTNFGAIGAPTTMQGNADADVDVDGHDFLIWQRNVGATPATAVALPIPEPAAAILAFVAASAIALQCRRRSRAVSA